MRMALPIKILILVWFFGALFLAELAFRIIR